ncbi:MAG: PAS domain S-box protein [Planctomycetia bacterium]|nr:PAS domain S-box protein [Planctomycetia bacterium]
MPESPNDPAPPVSPAADAGGRDPSTPEQQLQLEYQRLASHVENTPLAVIEWDHQLRVTRWNGQAERVFGWSASEVIGKGPHDWNFVHVDDKERVKQLMGDVFAGRSPRTVLTNRNYTKSGSVVWCEWHNSVLYDEAGKLWSVLSLALDITERRQTAEALVHSEERLRAALDGAKMLGWDLDLVANRWETSIDLPDFYGVPHGPDYSDPETALSAVHPDDVPIVLAGRKRAIETGGPMSYEFRGRVPAPDGLTRWFSTRGRVLRDESGRPVRIVAVTTDITERKRAEDERESLNRQLLDAQKWESLGVLAGGVAHDFNNILTIVLGSSGLARRALPPDSPVLGHLDQIERAGRRAADVCRQMLAYAGRGHTSSGRTELAALIRESAPLLDIPAAGAGTVRLELDDQLPPVAADPAQVRQVLVNLVMNAAEALDNKLGQIVVRTNAVEVSLGTLDASFRLAPVPGKYVRMTITDTGPGLTPEVQARMFDPFFTTKFAGRGLGLAAVLGIVRAHKGGLRVESAPGRGTVVAVYWPVSPDAPPVPAIPPPAKPSARRDATALVIDDEMYVREVTASTLEEMGFAPLLAADGPSGIEVFRLHSNTIKLVVIDVMMPGMTGDQVLTALRGFNPTLPAVLMSGFTDKRIIKDEFATLTEFLQKPFHPEDLMDMVKRLVATPAE